MGLSSMQNTVGRFQSHSSHFEAFFDVPGSLAAMPWREGPAP